MYMISGASGLRSGLLLGNYSYIGAKAGQGHCKVWTVILDDPTGAWYRCPFFVLPLLIFLACIRGHWRWLWLCHRRPADIRSLWSCGWSQPAWPGVRSSYLSHNRTNSEIATSHRSHPSTAAAPTSWEPFPGTPYYHFQQRRARRTPRFQEMDWWGQCPGYLWHGYYRHPAIYASFGAQYIPWL